MLMPHKPAVLIGWSVLAAALLAGCGQSAGGRLEESGVQPGMPVLVKFYSPQCPHCTAFAPIFEDLSRQYAGRVEFKTVNTDVKVALAEKYNVFRLPTVILFADGQERQRWEGQLLEQPYEHALNRLLGQDRQQPLHPQPLTIQ